MRKPLLTLLAALVLVACNESLEDRAEREAREYTARYCPTPVMNNSRTDSVAFDKATKTYTYYCTLTGEYDSAEFIAKYGGELNSRLAQTIADDASIEKLKAAGFSFHFVIHSERAPEKVLYERTITAKEYDNPPKPTATPAF